MKLGDGLFLRSCQEIASLYPNIKFDNMIVDNTTMQVLLLFSYDSFSVFTKPKYFICCILTCHQNKNHNLTTFLTSFSQMTSNPQQFDVLVMPNLYGNIIDNLGAGKRFVTFTVHKASAFALIGT